MSRLVALAVLGFGLVGGAACNRQPIYDPEVDQGLVLGWDTRSTVGPHYVRPACTPRPGAERLSGKLYIVMLVNEDGTVSDARLQRGRTHAHERPWWALHPPTGWTLIDTYRRAIFGVFSSRK